MSDGPSRAERERLANELAQRAGDYLMEMSREKGCGSEVAAQAAVNMAGAILDSVAQANPAHVDQLIAAARLDFAKLTTHVEQRAKRLN